MKKSFSLILFVFLLCATGLWYFGIHRPARKMLNSNPKTIYKTTVPSSPNSQPVIRDSTGSTTFEHGNETEMESPTAKKNVVVDTTDESTDMSSSDTFDHSDHEGSNEHTQEPHEQEVSEHKHLDENAESEYSQELLEKAGVELEAAAKLQEEGQIVLANYLNAMPVEKQVAMLEKMKREFINAQNPSTGAPTFDNREQARAQWQELFEGILAAGYAPPAGFE